MPLHGIVIFILSVEDADLWPGVAGRTWRFNCRDSLCLPLEFKPGEALGRRRIVSLFDGFSSFPLFLFFPLVLSGDCAKSSQLRL